MARLLRSFWLAAIFASASLLTSCAWVSAPSSEAPKNARQQQQLGQNPKLMKLFLAGKISADEYKKMSSLTIEEFLGSNKSSARSGPAPNEREQPIVVWNRGVGLVIHGVNARNPDLIKRGIAMKESALPLMTKGLSQGSKQEIHASLAQDALNAAYLSGDDAFFQKAIQYAQSVMEVPAAAGRAGPRGEASLVLAIAIHKSRKGQLNREELLDVAMHFETAIKHYQSNMEPTILGNALAGKIYVLREIINKEKNSRIGRENKIIHYQEIIKLYNNLKVISVGSDNFLETFGIEQKIVHSRVEVGALRRDEAELDRLLGDQRQNIQKADQLGDREARVISRWLLIKIATSRNQISRLDDRTLDEARRAGQEADSLSSELSDENLRRLIRRDIDAFHRSLSK